MTFRARICALLFVMAACATSTLKPVSQRFLDPRPWVERGRMESAEMPVHPVYGARMGVGPDPALGCVPIGPTNEEALLERALQHMLELPGATNCIGDVSTSRDLHALEYCGVGYSYHGMFCTTIPSASTSMESYQECDKPSAGVIHLEPGQQIIDMESFTKAYWLQRGFPLVQYILHTHPCANTSLSQKDVTTGLITIRYQGDDARGSPAFAPSIVRYAVSSTGEVDRSRPIEGWLRTPSMEFRIDLVSGDVWRKKIPRGGSGAGIPWEPIGKCIVNQRMMYASQQCVYTTNPLD